MSALSISLVAAVSYLLGSIPTAWIVVRRAGGGDIRTEGSGNVGAMNVLGVTGSRMHFIVVFAVDAAKGAAAVFAARFLIDDDTMLVDGVALVGVVVGHNFNVWLSLKSRKLQGGKGLASALGGLLVSMPLTLPAWIIFFLLGFFLYKMIVGSTKIAPGSTLGTLASPFAAYYYYGTAAFVIVTLMGAVILYKHADDIKLMFGSSTSTKDE